MKLEIPSNVKKIMELLNDKKFEAYIVGGCVRDSLINKTPNDFDITTNALPDEVIDVFKNMKVILNGVKHGTVTVVMDKELFEITTYRIEKEYKDFRRPDGVEYARSLSEDLKRRDFTINAMAYNDKDGVVDLFGGVDDLKNKIIKTVGNPNERFNEDALRVMRAIRFSAVLGFDIEKNTLNAIYKNACLIKHISKERICEELNKIIISQNTRALKILIDTKILNYVLGDSIYINYSEDIALFEGDVDLVLSYLFINKYNDEINILKSLRYSNKTIKKVNLIKKYSDINISDDKIQIKKTINELGVSNFVDLIKYKSVIDKKDYLSTNLQLENILNNKECFSLKQLNINGDDIKKIYSIKGKDIGNILNKLLDEVIKNPNLNNKNDLLKICNDLKLNLQIN